MALNSLAPWRALQPLRCMHFQGHWRWGPVCFILYTHFITFIIRSTIVVNIWLLQYLYLINRFHRHVCFSYDAHLFDGLQGSLTCLDISDNHLLEDITTSTSEFSTTKPRIWIKSCQPNSISWMTDSSYWAFYPPMEELFQLPFFYYLRHLSVIYLLFFIFSSHVFY